MDTTGANDIQATFECPPILAEQQAVALRPLVGPHGSNAWLHRPFEQILLTFDQHPPPR